MLGVSGTTQYINPDYVQPLPTSLDAKNSPLALLAQTCSSIGKDSNSSSTSSSSSSSSSSASTSKLHQHQQIHSSSSDKKDLSSRLANGKDGSVRIKSSDSCSTTVDHNGVHNHSGLGGSNYNHYKLSSSGKCYIDRGGPKENGRSSAGRVSVSPPKHKLSSSNGLGLNGTKHHLPKSDNGASYRNSMAYYNGKIPDDYSSGSLSSVHHHQQSKLSPTAAASPLQSLKMQQDLFNAAFSMGYPPWMIGQSPFMPPAFDPFLLSAAALSSQQHKQQLLQLHQQLFSSLSGYQASDLGGAASGLASSAAGSHKHDTDAGVSPSGKSPGAGQPSGGNAILPSTSIPNLYPISTSHIPSQSGSQSQLSPNTHPYSCNWFQPGSDFCGKRFASYEELLEHLKSHVTTPGASLSAADDSRLFPASMYPFMFGMTPSFGMPSGYNLNSNYLLQQQAAAASLFQHSFSPSSAPTPSTSSLSSSSSSSHLSSRYHPYKSPLPSSSTSVSSSLSSSSSLFSGLLPFPSPSSAVTSPFSALMPPFGYGFPYPMYNQKIGETGAGP